MTSRQILTHFLLLIATVVAAPATTPTWEWAARGGGPAYESARNIVADGSGNAYVLGTYIETASFGTTQLTSAGNMDAYVAKYSAGKWAWACSIGGSSFDTPGKVTLGSDGNIYVVSTVLGNTVSVHTASGDTTFSAGAAACIMIACISPEGKLLWGKTIDCDESSQGRSILEIGERIYLAGSFRQSLTIDGTSATSAGSDDLFLALFDRHGSLQKLIAAGTGGGADMANDLAADSAGRIYLAGHASGPITIGGTTVPGTSSASSLLLARFSPVGDLQWALQDGGAGFTAEQIWLAVSPSGDSYVAGSFRGNGTLGASPIQTEGGDDGFVARYDPDGKEKWVQTQGSNMIDVITGVSADSQGSVYVNRFSQLLEGTESVVTMYQPDGSIGWKLPAVNGSNSVAGVSAAPDGTLLVCGTYTDALTLGGTSLTSNGSVDLFIAALGSGLGVQAQEQPTAPPPYLELAGPNPARSDARLMLTLPRSSQVTLRLFTLTGKLVYSATDRFPAGMSFVTVPTGDLPSGRYSAEIDVDGERRVVPLVMMR